MNTFRFLCAQCKRDVELLFGELISKIRHKSLALPSGFTVTTLNPPIKPLSLAWGQQGSSD